MKTGRGLAVSWSMLSLLLLRSLLRLRILDMGQWSTGALLFDLMLLEHIAILLESFSVLLRVILRMLMLLLPCKLLIVHLQLLRLVLDLLMKLLWHALLRLLLRYMLLNRMLVVVRTLFIPSLL